MRTLLWASRDDDGATALEYALLLLLVALVALTALQLLGSAVGGIFSNMASIFSPHSVVH